MPGSRSSSRSPSRHSKLKRKKRRSRSKSRDRKEHRRRRRTRSRSKSRLTNSHSHRDRDRDRERKKRPVRSSIFKMTEDICRKRLEDAYKNVQAKYDFQEVLKKEQVDSLLHLLGDEDTLCVLPTGYGKSLIYILLPLILDEIQTDRSHTIIVVSPLKSLMTDQAGEIRRRGVSVGVLTGDTTAREMAMIKSAQVSIVMGSPEMLLKHADALADDTYERTVVCLAVDECHNLIDWTDFRPVYRDLPQLKAIVASRKPWALLTATCDETLRKGILASLHLEKVNTIAVPPNRENIFLEVTTEKAMILTKWFEPLARELQDFDNSRKTIVYCRSKDKCGEIFSYLITQLRDAAFHGKSRIVEQFSSSYEEDDEQRIMERLTTNDPTLRCVVTTIALGMGINLKGVQQVIHWGAPDNLLRYWQEVGRAGRAGGQASAHLLCYGASMARVSTTMKDFLKGVKEGKCIRRLVMESLTLSDACVPDHSEILQCKNNCDVCTCPTCKCCSNCQKKCPCFL